MLTVMVVVALSVAQVPEEKKPSGFVIPFEVLGSKKKLDAVKCIHFRATASFTIADNINDLDISWGWPMQMKFAETLPDGEEVYSVWRGDSGVTFNKLSPKHQWTTKPMTKDGWTFDYSFFAGVLLPLKTPGFEIRQDETRFVNGQKCDTIIVSRVGSPEMTLHFAADTKLLWKSSFVYSFHRHARRSWKPRGPRTFVEAYYSDYKDTDGIKHWTKRVEFRDGEEYDTIRIADVRFFNEVKPALFLPPREYMDKLSDDAARKLVLAKDQLRQAKAAIAEGNTATGQKLREFAERRFREIVTNYPGTEAAIEAREILNNRVLFPKE